MLGDINVMGQSGGNSSNTIAANVDLGGGTQVVRTSQQGSASVNAAADLHRQPVQWIAAQDRRYQL